MTRPFDPERDWPCWCGCGNYWEDKVPGHTAPAHPDDIGSLSNVRINVPHAVAEAWFRRGVEEGWLR